MVNKGLLLLLLVGLILFHKFIYPFIVGFIKGYKDGRNGNPYPFIVGFIKGYKDGRNGNPYDDKQ
jgi:hypothetical protein